MPKADDFPDKFEALREQAEELIRRRPDADPRIPFDVLELIDELRIHQAELEIQNDELRRAQEELSGLHREYERLYEFAPCGYITLSAKRIITRANLTAVRLLGETKHRLYESSFSRFIQVGDPRDSGKPAGLQDHSARYLAALQKAAETGDKQSVELPLKKEKGSAGWVRAEIEADRNDAGAAIQWRILLLDITEKRAADEARRESEAKFRSMMESMKDEVCIISKNFRIEYMNPRMISRIGRNAVGEICHSVLYDGKGKCTWCAMDRIQAGEHVEYEFENPTNGRSYIVINSPLYHADGTFSKLVVFHDVTEVKAMEARVSHSRKMASIGTMAGGVAHNFNNILYVILGNAEMALDVAQESSAVRKNLVEIRTAGERGAALVRQILNFSHAAKGEFRRIDAADIVKETHRFLRSTVPATVEIRTDLPEMETPISADPSQVQQALMNIALNAVRELEETGGTIDIALGTTRVPAAGIGAHPNLTPGDYVKITVRDNGPGIDPGIIDRIFDPFFTTREIGRGDGLGLSMVHGIVKNHRGAVSADSRPGQGATFTLYFPLADVENVPAAVAAPDDTPTGSERILFVDDERAIVNMAKGMLERLGYQIQTRQDPGEALSLFREAPDRFDLVMTDMTMPGMTGVELFRRLKAIRPDIPVLLCTGHSTFIDEEEAGTLGFAGFILKPIARREIAGVVRQALEAGDA